MYNYYVILYNIISHTTLSYDIAYNATLRRRGAPWASPPRPRPPAPCQAAPNARLPSPAFLIYSSLSSYVVFCTHACFLQPSTSSRAQRTSILGDL